MQIPPLFSMLSYWQAIVHGNRDGIELHFALFKFLSFYTVGEANINKRIDSHEVLSRNPLFLDSAASAGKLNLIFKHVGKGPGEQNGGLKKAGSLKGARPFQLDTRIHT
jgi:hypothetical protein